MSCQLYTHSRVFFFFNDTATTEIYTLSLHDALPICYATEGLAKIDVCRGRLAQKEVWVANYYFTQGNPSADRKSTRLNSSHDQISYAVFCLKKKKQRMIRTRTVQRVMTTTLRMITQT